MKNRKKGQKGKGNGNCGALPQGSGLPGIDPPLTPPPTPPPPAVPLPFPAAGIMRALHAQCPVAPPRALSALAAAGQLSELLEQFSWTQRLLPGSPPLATSPFLPAPGAFCSSLLEGTSSAGPQLEIPGECSPIPLHFQSGPGPGARQVGLFAAISLTSHSLLKTPFQGRCHYSDSNMETKK